MKADFIASVELPGYGYREWVDATAAQFRVKGATWIRVSHPLDRPDEGWLEGWIVKPENQGPHPWESAIPDSTEEPQ